MSSPQDASGTRNNPPRRALPSPSCSYQPTRKAPPLSLAITSSSLSYPKTLTTKHSSISPNARNSLESSRSDLTSVHSEVTSLHCSEFPIPPSALPPIPASPTTPRSLYFSTTPTTPRSQSPNSGFALPMQEPPRGSGRALLGSPKSLKGIFSGARSPSSQSKFASQQDQLPQGHVPSESLASRSLDDLKHGYERSRLSVPARYSQYAVYKATNRTDASQAETPTTVGTQTQQDWLSGLSSSDRSSLLQPPRPAYVRGDVAARSHSPLRAGSSFATQQEEAKQSLLPTRNESPQSPHSTLAQPPQSPRSMSPQPPRSPLPVPPTKRDSARDSGRYSHIARKAGVTDMGLDISEEQLLSTDFITEMLKQPATSPRSARFLRLPDSPRSLALSDDPHDLGKHIRGSEMRLAPESNLALASPGFAPKSVSMSEQSVALEDMLGPGTPGPGSSLSRAEDGTDDQSPDMETRSLIASSVFSKGGDKIYFDGPSLLPVSPMPFSPNSQSLTVPTNIPRGHGSPHPLVPSTPMSGESFADPASPRKLGGFAQAQAKHISEWRKSTAAIKSRLPIGPSSPGVTLAVEGRKVTSPLIGSPRVRQHHYPRTVLTKLITQTNQKPVTTEVQHAPSAASSSPSPIASKEPLEEIIGERKNECSAQGAPIKHETVTSNTLSVLSNAETHRNSLNASPTVDSRRASSHETAQSNQRSSQSQVHSDHTYDSNFLSSDSVYDDEESNMIDIEGEVQTASRVWDTTIPIIARGNNVTGPTVVGTATAVVVRSLSVDRRATEEIRQDHLRLNASDPTSSIGPETSTPSSPQHPPSIVTPLSHRTDMPESAKSVYYSEDVHNVRQRAYLPYDEVTGYGPSFWDINYNASSGVQPSTTSPQRRPSENTSSIKSVVSYLTARSRASTVNSKVTKVSYKSTQSTGSSRWAWLSKKPLPPLPPPSPLPPSVLDTTSLDHGKPTLSVRKEHSAGTAPVLEPGQYQKSKISLVGQGEPQGWSDITNEKWSPENASREDETAGSSVFKSLGKFDMLGVDSIKVAKRKPSRQRSGPKLSETFDNGPRDLSNFSDSQPSRRTLGTFQPMVNSKTRKRLFFALIGIAMLAIILGAALGATLGHKHTGNASSSCSGDKVGVQCNLDATCTCPSSLTSGVCDAPLAGALSGLVPVASQLFTTNITSEGMALVLWESQGIPTTPNCAFQANLVDVGSVLDANVSPNRTQWAQAALLWNLYQSGDIDATQSMQLAIERLPFGSLDNKDGIEADPSGQFSVSLSGYIFNFANQTVTAPSLTFNIDGSPSSDQLSRVNIVMEGALDRMYSFASASSTQRQAALSTYWRSVLSLSPSDLPTFLIAFRSSPILLPFDATSSPGGQAIANLLTEAINRTLSFPPAVGCYPGLSSSQLQQISTVETQAFGLTGLNSSSSNFDSSCFANHPVYGVLDVLRTRLPFSDSRSGVAKQAAVLNSDAGSRVVLHVGELLDAFPAPISSSFSSFDVNPRDFGTLSHVNHIALEWLQSFPTPALAAEAAQFVLSSPTSPPPSSSSLFNATSLPTVEVAIFGDIFLSDYSSFLSSFSMPSGSLFFGSSQAQAFRRWALQQSSSSATIAWSQNTFAPQVVHETSSTNSLFEQIWSNAGGSNSVQQVVNALTNAGLFSS